MHMILAMAGRPDLENLTERELDELSVRLRRARRDAGLQQSEAAAALAVSNATISRLERAEGKARRWQIRLLADLYQVRFDWLAYGEGEAPAETSASRTPAQTTSEPAPEELAASHVLQYLVCPICGQDALTPNGLVPHLTSDRCEKPHTPAEAQILAAKATVDPQPWAYVLARYERQLEAAREAARFRLRGRTHWRRLVRVVRKARDRMLESGPDAFLIRNPRLDDPYWIPSDLESPEWPSAIRGSLSDAELDEIERDTDRG